MKKPGSRFFAITAIAALSACAGIYNDYDMNNSDPVDRPTGRTREEFIDNLTPAPKPIQPKVELKEPPLPRMSDVLAAPKPPKIGSDKNVTIAVTDNIQLKDVFMELSRLADVDIEVDPTISGGVMFRAKDRPFSEVVERISEMAGLRYSVNNGVIRVENDTPYVESYQANILNMIRTSEGEVSISTKLFSGGSESSTGSGTSSTNNSSSSSSSSSSSDGDNGSESTIKSSTAGDGDLWTSLEKEITAIIKAAPQAAGARPGVPAAATSSDTFVSANREAGLITVKTTQKNHAKIKQYLDIVKSYYSAQVLIEAKVVEVTLNDEYRSGIDWSFVSTDARGRGFSLDNNAVTGFPTESFTGGQNLTTLSFVRGDITAAVDLAQVFGTTRTLSSPRLLAMNNQQAVLSFARNETYFTLTCATTTTQGVNGSPPIIDAEVSSQINTIPVGVILNLQAAIDTKSNEISMNIRPTLSRLTGKSVNDPAVSICANQAGLNLTSSIPQVDIREMDSILKLKNGEVMVIGGMIEQKNINTDSGIPYASEVPVLGNIFKTVDKQNQAVQTVIFLKATIVPGYGVDGSDQNFYQKFNTDPRPLKF